MVVNAALAEKVRKIRLLRWITVGPSVAIPVICPEKLAMILLTWGWVLGQP